MRNEIKKSILIFLFIVNVIFSIILIKSNLELNNDKSNLETKLVELDNEKTKLNGIIRSQEDLKIIIGNQEEELERLRTLTRLQETNLIKLENKNKCDIINIWKVMKI